MADPTYTAIAPIATIQVTASVIVTAVLTLILTSFVYNHVQRRRAGAARPVPLTAPIDPLVHGAPGGD
jgi:2-keto-3-deoxygluconate permease